MAEPKPGPPMPPAQLQRAVFIAVLSFFFFMAMMLAFYIRQSILYFLLASAFLIVYIITMISFVRMRRGPR
jgi:type IV secretory pathway VirB6-like protein